MRLTLLPPRSLRFPAILAIAAILFGTIALKPARNAEALTNCSYSDTFDSEEASFLTLINQYRAQNGLGALTVSSNLNRASGWLANDMATHNYMDHTDSLGRSFGTRLQQCDTQFSSAAENVAAGYQTAADVFQGWKNSPGHNTNMLGASYKQIGIARAYSASSTYGWYWATDFSSVDDGTRVTGGGTSATATATKTSTAIAATATRTSTTVVATATKTSTAVASTPTKTATMASASPTKTATSSPASPTKTATSVPGGSAKAVMTSPTSGSRFTSTSVTFNWSPATNASEYFFYLGTTPGANNIFGQSMALNRSLTLNGLPSNGSALYVRLWTRVGNTWSFNDYRYTSK